MNSPARSIEGLEMRTAGHETIVHDPAHDKLHVLNGMAARILAMCDGTRSAQDIAKEITAQTGAPFDVVLRDVEAIIGRFSELQLLL